MDATKEVKALTKKQAASVAKEASQEVTSHAQRGATGQSGRVIVQGDEVLLVND